MSAAAAAHPAKTAHAAAAVRSITSYRAFHGHTVIALFVATSCMYCAYEAKNEIPDLIKWARANKVSVVITNASDTLGIGKPGKTPSTGVDGPWTPTNSPVRMERDLAQWAAVYHLNGYVYADPSLNLFKKYGIGGFPAGMVLDAKGNYVAKWDGILPIAAIENVAKLANLVVQPGH